MNIYKAPNSDPGKIGSNIDHVAARKRLKFVLVVFVVNFVFAAIFISTKGVIVGLPKYLLIACWLSATVAYAFFAGAYFSVWGKFRCLWGIPILVFQPLSLLVTFPYILLKSRKHAWHKDA